jgi:F-type H+-transporting ATPase subunit gamma
MTDSTAALKHQIGVAQDLQSVVRTMRALAASSITQYERSVLALSDYRQAVNQGLSACLRAAHVSRGVMSADDDTPPEPPPPSTVGVIVLGSDQGLVGQFNEVIVEHVVHALRDLPGRRQIWAVGERVRARLVDVGLAVTGTYTVPNAVDGIAPLVDQLQIDTETHPGQTVSPHIHVFYNKPKSGALYEPARLRLLPLDAAWRDNMLAQPWPGKALPEVMGHGDATLRALIREHLFISLFSACAESLASENASRLAAMQRADKNIVELLESLHGKYHALRQRSIDNELFEVIAGYQDAP